VRASALAALALVSLAHLASSASRGTAYAGDTQGSVTPVRSDGGVESVAFTPDGKQLLIGRCNGLIEVRTVPGGKSVTNLHAPDWVNSEFRIQIP
jgi:WD40 repeat protein